MNSLVGFFGSIYEFSFKKFITPYVIKVFYGVFILAAAVFSVFRVVDGFRESVNRGVLWLVLAPVVFFLLTVGARVVLETFSVLFRISGETSAIHYHEHKADTKEPRLAA